MGSLAPFLPPHSVPMVGRSFELGLIVEALRQAKAGHGGAISIRGEAGMGKSRLRLEAGHAARRRGFLLHEGRSIPVGGLAYWGVAELIRSALGAAPGDPPTKLCTLLHSAGARLGLAPADRRHLAGILGLEGPRPPGELRPRDVRQNDMIAIRALLQALARECPRLLVLEDMHWADGATMEASRFLAEGPMDAPMLLLLVHRPGYSPPAGVPSLLLSALDGGDVTRLIRAHLGDVPESLEELIRERAGGNPFCVEELAHHLRESGRGLDDVPESVEAVIAARLDRLPDKARRVAQHAAVVGRSFHFDLLERLPAIARDAAPSLRELLARELVFEKARKPRLEYIFKHALTRDVAYAGILGARRRAIHRAVADAIEVMLHDERDTFLPILGHHRERAGQAAEACSSYLAAARHALRRHALEEAAWLYRRSLGLAPTPTPERIEARIELGGKVLHVRGSTGDAEAALRKAAAEAGALSSPALRSDAHRGLAVVLHATGRGGEALGEYAAALAFAREAGDARREAAILGNLANLDQEQGRMEEARARYDAALRIHRVIGDRAAEAVVLGNMARMEHVLGKPQEARALYERALAVHRQVGARIYEGHVLANLGSLELEQGQRDAARELCEQALAALREVGDRRVEGSVLGNIAILAEEVGRHDEALSLYEQALRIHRDTMDRRNEAAVLGNLAHLHLRQGRRALAREMLERSLELARNHGERRIEGRSLGILGHLLQEEGLRDEGLACYEQALRIHRDVGDRQFEGTLLGNVGVLLHEERRHDEAASRFDEAIAIHREVGNRRQEGHMLGCLGALLLDRGVAEEAREHYLHALTIMWEVGDRAGEAACVGRLGHLACLIDGDVVEAERALAKAMAMLEGAGERVELAHQACLAGHVELAAGRTARQLLRRADELSRELGLGSESAVGRAVAVLSRAQAAFDGGERLVCGYRPEDLTAGQVRWLAEHGPDIASR